VEIVRIEVELSALVHKRSTTEMSYPFHRIFAAFESLSKNSLACGAMHFPLLPLSHSRFCVFFLECNRNESRGTRRRAKGINFLSSQNTDFMVFIKSLYIFYLLG
jgi:hypothetical protein